MKKILTSFGAILLFFSILLTSCQQKEKELDNALLWKISGNGLTNPSYILGTHHLMNVNVLDNVKGFPEALASCDQVVGEVAANPSELRQIRIALTEDRKAQMVDYKELLSVEDYNKLNNAFVNVLGADTTYMMGLHPSTISGIYSDFLYSAVDPSYNSTNHEAMDFYVQRIATDKGKNLLGLESVEDQVSLMAAPQTLKEQTEVLICLLENSSSMQKFVKDLDTSYKEKSLSKIYNLYSDNKNSPCPDFFAKQFKMDRERNQVWMKRIPDLMKEKSSLIAVGALHLAGDDGLLAELKKLGYTIEAVN